MARVPKEDTIKALDDLISAIENRSSGSSDSDRNMLSRMLGIFGIENRLSSRRQNRNGNDGDNQWGWPTMLSENPKRSAVAALQNLQTAIDKRQNKISASGTRASRLEMSKVDVKKPKERSGTPVADEIPRRWLGIFDNQSTIDAPINVKIQNPAGPDTTFAIDELTAPSKLGNFLDAAKTVAKAT